MSKYIMSKGEQLNYAQVSKEIREKWPVRSMPPMNALDYVSVLEDVSVDIPSLVNRPTEKSAIEKILASKDGFDGAVWDPPRVARIKSTGKMYLFDGDHRRALWKVFFPNEKTMPMRVVEVDSIEDIHANFVQVNHSGKNKMTAEQIFVHDFLSGDEEAKQYEKDFKAAGIKIFCSWDAKGTAGDSDGVYMKYHGAKKLISLAKKANKKGLKGNLAQQTIDLLRQVCDENDVSDWQSDPAKPLKAELAGGLLLALGAWSNVCTSPEFSRWLKSKLEYSSVSQLAEDFKSTGGSIVNHAQYSICKGIQSEINKAYDSGKFPTMEKKLSTTRLHHFYKKPSPRQGKK
tara:strand:+ start:190 stop:1224 length:1035 start_codon:yes stop_codon:yes gene_type:complete